VAGAAVVICNLNRGVLGVAAGPASTWPGSAPLPFTLVGLTAGFAGIVYESRLGSISVGFDGGTYVLYAVAAAVIGGASLMGGRGKAIHPLIGGLVLAVVANGLDLLNITTAGQDMATALVLLIAVTIDSVVRRRGVVAG